MASSISPCTNLAIQKASYPGRAAHLQEWVVTVWAMLDDLAHWLKARALIDADGALVEAHHKKAKSRRSKLLPAQRQARLDELQPQSLAGQVRAQPQAN